jgi:hypothetical protein
MSHVIDHFMWGYQPHFRINQKCTADALFNLLDKRIQPEVFLVGVRFENRNDRYPCCVEPEDDFWIPSEAFDGTLKLAEELFSAYPEINVLISNDLAAKRYSDNLHRRSIKEAILNTINNWPQKKSEIEYFASFPQPIEGFWVTVILGLPKYILNENRHLHIDHVNDINVSRSLIDCVIAEFLAISADKLQKPEPGSLLSDKMDLEGIIRAAGHHFTMDIAFRADSHLLDGVHVLFRACNIISSSKYEQTAAIGRMIIARKDHDCLKPNITFISDLKLDKFRGARKLLELASHSSALHTDSYNVFGLVDCLEYNPKKEDLFEVKFLGHYYWELLHAGKTLMQVKFGQPYLPKRSEYEIKLPKDLPRIFKGINTENIELLISLIRSAEKEKHGTMLIFSTNAMEESHRLKTQGTIIEPKELTPEMLVQLTPIDGSVIIDPRGYCYAIGVILDGIASDDFGDPSRGARYNSALRYVHFSIKRSIACLAAVISEDGGVDLVPDLLPTIKKSEIDAAVQELESLIHEIKIPMRRYSNLTDWLETHKFYLQKHHCDSVNQSIQLIEKRLNEEDPSRFQRIWPPFIPDQRMYEALYYDQE